nr:hypothetical protein [uncultured Agrobacterium sp.]
MKGRSAWHGWHCRTDERSGLRPRHRPDRSALHRPDRRPEFGRVGQIDGGGYRNILNRGTRSPQFDGNQGIDRLRRELPVFSGYRRSYDKPGGVSELWPGGGNGIRAGRRIIAASD